PVPRGEQPGQRRQDSYDDQREHNVGSVEVERLDEIVETGLPIPRRERGDERITERVDEQRQHHRQRRGYQEQRKRPPIRHGRIACPCGQRAELLHPALVALEDVVEIRRYREWLPFGGEVLGRHGDAQFSPGRLV